MERITLVQYLTALQGALRATVALCALILILLCANKRSHIPAFKYLQSFILVIGIWGFFSSVFFSTLTPRYCPMSVPLSMPQYPSAAPPSCSFAFHTLCPIGKLL